MFYFEKKKKSNNLAFNRRDCKKKRGNNCYFIFPETSVTVKILYAVCLIESLLNNTSLLIWMSCFYLKAYHVTFNGRKY